MATTPDQIDLWRASATEHERLEFKEAKNQYDYQKLQEYCSRPRSRFASCWPTP